jgi:hypothetical protein
MKKRKGPMRAGKSTREFELAVMKAEKTLKRPKGPNETVLLMPSEIKTRPELFQVREFSFGAIDTDPDHVKTLARNIGIHGELDPITVIKLGTKFVIVEGHRRVGAYKSVPWTQPITCKWFAGSVREAIDESMRAKRVLDANVVRGRATLRANGLSAASNDEPSIRLHGGGAMRCCLLRPKDLLGKEVIASSVFGANRPQQNAVQGIFRPQSYNRFCGAEHRRARGEGGNEVVVHPGWPLALEPCFYRSQNSGVAMAQIERLRPRRGRPGLLRRQDHQLNL